MKKEITFEIVGDCHVCTSHMISSEGYPVQRYQGNGNPVGIHRIVYEERYGEIPDGLVVRHRCDNRKCINPAHLELGKHKDNVQDRVERNRSAKGAKNGRSKLTEEKVRQIKASDLSPTVLSKIYGIDPKGIRDIRQGKIWKHVC